jgi:hypothetical protein
VFHPWLNINIISKLNGKELDMKTHVVLTVAESKRLIAKGVAAMDIVKKALADGMVTVGRGTTNGRVAEEILGEKIDRAGYIAGRVLPAKGARVKLSSPPIPEVVLKNGQQVEGVSAVESVVDMQKGDVFIKGANAINYQQKMCGILVGHPTGGTISTIATIVSRKINLIIPIGLEKCVYGDINELSMKTREGEFIGNAPSLMQVTGIIVTDIEALKTLAGVDAMLISSGGIAGAEGAVWLLLEGEKDRLENALQIIEECREIEQGAEF